MKRGVWALIQGITYGDKDMDKQQVGKLGEGRDKELVRKGRLREDQEEDEEEEDVNSHHGVAQGNLVVVVDIRVGILDLSFT